MPEQKKFYRELSTLAIPIIIQNLLSSGIGSLDTLMLNWIGQNELAAVSLANQLFFVLNLFFLGLTGSTGIMMAQYLGKGDEERSNQIFTIATMVSSAVCTVFGLLAMLLPHWIMRIFTGEAELIRIGSEYLRIVGLSYLMMGFIQTYLAALKARKKAAKSVMISAFALIANFVLNAVFIFGLLGAPKLGVVGVAVATCLARGMELIVCAADMMSIIRRERAGMHSMEGTPWKHSEENLWDQECPTAYQKQALCLRRHTERQLQVDFLRIASPMTLQGFVFGGAMAAMSAIMGHLGSDAVAANSIASVIQNIATVASFGLAEAGSVFLGNDLGEGSFEKAKGHAGALMKLAVICGIAGCVLMLLAEYPVAMLLNLTDISRQYLAVMYKILSVNVIFASITYTMLCGVFPAGGDTKYGLCIDGIVLWGLVALGSAAAFVLKWNPIAVFVILNVDELTKTPFVIRKYYKWDWVKNITIQNESKTTE